MNPGFLLLATKLWHLLWCEEGGVGSPDELLALPDSAHVLRSKFGHNRSPFPRSGSGLGPATKEQVTAALLGVDASREVCQKFYSLLLGLHSHVCQGRG